MTEEAKTRNKNNRIIKKYCEINDILNTNLIFSFDNDYEGLMIVAEHIVATKFSDDGIQDNYYFRTFGMLDEDGNYMVRINRYSLHKGKTLSEALWLAIAEFCDSN